MAIQTKGEFDIQMGDLLLQVDRLLEERSRDAPLQVARRTLGQIAHRLKRGEKLDPKERQSFAGVLETVHKAAGGDEAMQDRLADLEDWIDANAKK